MVRRAAAVDSSSSHLGNPSSYRSVRGGGGASIKPRRVLLYSNAQRGEFRFIDTKPGARGGELATLVGGASTRILASFRPLAPGPRKSTFLVHAIDSETGALVGAWRVGAFVGAAVITRVYDLILSGVDSDDATLPMAQKKLSVRLF